MGQFEKRLRVLELQEQCKTVVDSLIARLDKLLVSLKSRLIKEVKTSLDIIHKETSSSNQIISEQENKLSGLQTKQLELSKKLELTEIEGKNITKKIKNNNEKFNELVNQERKDW